MSFEVDPDRYAEELIKQFDDTVMPLPSIDSQPHTLISKVRKHYLDYLTKLLTLNYETACKMQTRNVHLPSGIWRCAYFIELNAARSSMVLNLYREHILLVIKKLKSATKNGKLYNHLTNSLLTPKNDKKLQTSFIGTQTGTCTCKCTCNGRATPKKQHTMHPENNLHLESNNNIDNNQSTLELQTNNFEMPFISANSRPDIRNETYNIVQSVHIESQNNKMCESNVLQESQDGDEVMMQLEQLFGNHNDQEDEDLFDSILCDNNSTTEVKNIHPKEDMLVNNPTNIVANEQIAKIRSLDERLAALESIGSLVVKNDDPKPPTPKPKHVTSRKWTCEVYFKKLRLYEKLDEIRDKNRKKHTRIKTKYLDLFGSDSDDEEMMSPINETAEFVRSCQERIAPWVVSSLTPYYTRGRIKSKILFKGVAKHLLKIIYQCNKYPSQYEVVSFVGDFLKNHSTIRCEADYKSFAIPNFGG